MEQESLKTNKIDVSSLSPEQKRVLLLELKKRKELAQQQTELSETAKNRLLFEFNRTEVDYSFEKTVIQLFEEQVSAFPELVALVENGTELTYTQLNAKANQLANRLRLEGIKKGDFVPVLLPQSFELFYSILAVLKLGAAYVPLDEKFPKIRIESILSACKANVIVTKQETEFQACTSINPEKTANQADQNLNIETNKNDLAYAIFTSGSTGNPKGVLISHLSLSNLCFWFNDYFQVDSSSVTSKFAGAAFDVSVAEIFPFLIKGAKIHILSESCKQDPVETNAYFEENQVSIAFLPTQFCELFMELENSSLKHLITAGEKLRKYIKRAYRLHNLYGPTENTVYTTYYEVTEDVANIPIGLPVANNQLYILDSKLNLVPEGEKGELCISGNHLATAYLNMEELTAEKFVDHPYLPGKRLYRTGDLASYQPDGTILFWGRIDQQLKIRGYRIEPGEIESQLLKHPSIRECIVIEKSEASGTNFLSCFYVSDRDLLSVELREFLSGTLPDYMIPSFFIPLERIPLTANGKTDRKALEQMDVKQHTETAYLAPTCEAQQKIVSYWKQVLGKEHPESLRIGIRDNFFEIGGNSLLAIKTVSKMSMDFIIKVNQLFEFPTIEALSGQIIYHPENIKHKITDLIESIEEQKLDPPKVSGEKITFLKTEISKYRNLQTGKKEIEQLSYSAVLLTGSLGFLGIHLLKELLENTSSHLYLLIRAKNEEEASKRLKGKLEFYFSGEALLETFPGRISVVCGDVSQKNLGITDDRFKPDCIIHVASKTSHYGEWSDFELINVTGTKNLVNFAKNRKIGRIQAISTISAGTGKAEEEVRFFSEYYRNMEHKSSNYYVQSKIEAEKILFDAASDELQIGIYRIGNLMPSLSNGTFQENAEENAFMNTLKLYFEFKVIPDLKARTYDFSYVDETAKALRMLMSVNEKEIGVYHLTNRFRLNDHELWEFIAPGKPEISLKPIVEILNDFLQNLDKPRYVDVMEEFIANSKILESGPQTKFYICNQKTEDLLNDLGFRWQKPDALYFGKFLKNLEKTTYFKN